MRQYTRANRIQLSSESPAVKRMLWEGTHLEIGELLPRTVQSPFPACPHAFWAAFSHLGASLFYRTDSWLPARVAVVRLRKDVVRCAGGELDDKMLRSCERLVAWPVFSLSGLVCSSSHS